MYVHVYLLLGPVASVTRLACGMLSPLSCNRKKRTYRAERALFLGAGAPGLRALILVVGTTLD